MHVCFVYDLCSDVFVNCLVMCCESCCHAEM
ncbi:hypothetical protein LINPERHAP2_LOCUS3284 [Linum perenne]